MTRLLNDQNQCIRASASLNVHLITQINTITLSVCISVPLWHGFSAYFFTPNPDIRILSGFFVQVRIGPYGMVW